MLNPLTLCYLQPKRADGPGVPALCAPARHRKGGQANLVQIRRKVSRFMLAEWRALSLPFGLHKLYLG